MTPEQARALTTRAHVAFALWMALSGLFGLLAVGLVGSVLAGSPHTPPATLLFVPPMLWIGAWLGLTFGTVWWYRKGIAAAAAAPDLDTRERVGRLMQVRPMFIGRNLAGVDLAGLPETRVARWLHSWRQIACHLVAIALLVLGAVLVD